MRMLLALPVVILAACGEDQRENKTERIDPKSAPIDGDCKKNTDVDEGKEVDGGECGVIPTRPGGIYKYKIDGHVILDPELDIQGPPPPPLGGTPTPSPQ